MATDPDKGRQGAPGQPGAPLSDWFDNYPVAVSGGDLFGDASPAVAYSWRRVAERLARLSDGDPAALQDMASRHTAELGLTFRVPGDDDERDWPLTAMPLIVGADEWAQVERGLVQRAELLEHLAADIYGPRRLVAEGHLPAAVIAGSPFFARKMLDRGAPGDNARPARRGHFIQLYSVDLARGPRGQWRVLQDRVRIATGIGYALENRLAMTRTTDGLLANGTVRRLADFFSQMRDGMAASCQREAPRIALMTPGRFNQTYPEQAHLARYLGFPLVEGRDLSVLDERLYVGTIAGPKRVDAVWRWIDTNALDPLSFDAKSALGVPGLFEAWDGNGVEMTNWPGAEVLESPAFAAFMPRLCRVLTGEDPILPNAATWWCGQAAEASIVASRLDELALLPAFGQAAEGFDSRDPVAGASLSGERRKTVLEALRRRPMDYCGQEIVNLSTTPAIIDGRITPCPFTLRAFVARTADGGWTVMPGGFARLSSAEGLPTTMMGAGDVSADVWIVDEKPGVYPARSLISTEPPISRGGGLLASQAADNLFWFGRYNERVEAVVRVVRAMLGSSMEIDLHTQSADGGALRTMGQILAEWGAIAPGSAMRGPAAICAEALGESVRPGSVAALLRRRQDVGLSLRDRFARDVWRLITSPMPRINPARPQSMLTVARWLTEHFSALAGLISENMVRGAAWRFLEMGQRIERAQTICRVAARMTRAGDTRENLGMLLDLFDSQIVYRSRYLSGPLVNPVRDLVLLDPDNPRALVFQVAEIVTHLEALPIVRDDNLPEVPLRLARQLHGELQAAAAADMTAARLARLEGQLLELSDAISARYFLDFDADNADKRTRLL